jgi:DNA adenine methylase
MVAKEDKYIPIVRWVGSKKRIIDKIIENVPEEFNDYYEPFVGGAIVFLYMPYEKKVFLNDCNKNVMNLYKQIKKSPEKLIKKVEKYEKEYLESNNKKEVFLGFREKFNKLINKYTLDKAALYISINKTSFNGLFQINKHGILTSAFANVKNPRFYKKEQIEKFSKKLKGVKLTSNDYYDALKTAKKGDFVYLDPPYVPDDFTKYNMNYSNKEWDEDDFLDLVEMVEELDERGCYVMLSNSDSKFIRKHFPKNKYSIIKIPIHRSLSPNLKFRGYQNELLIMNY